MKKEKSLIPSSGLAMQVAEEQEKRTLLAKYVRNNMVSGTDFYTLQIGGRETKPSLSKPGSEKVLSLFHWRAEFTKDDETWEMMGRPAGVLCYVCKLYTIKDSKLVGEGRGARDSKKDNGDINKAIKMAAKSAQIDAVLRTGGLSDLFTQDIEDMQEYENPKIPARAKVTVSGTDTDEPQIPTDEVLQKQTIMHFVKQLEPKTDMRSKKAIEAVVSDYTQMALVPENYVAIIEDLSGWLNNEK